MRATCERFDINRYFTVLTHLVLEDGYVLDYVYFAPGGDGAPYLYARREGERHLQIIQNMKKLGLRII